MPLADRFRPEKIDDVAGQSHIIGKGKLINELLEKKDFPNMIFFGPPGVGKTTIAEIIAKNSNKMFFKINATNSGLEDIRNVINRIGTFGTENGILLYIDEIQSFNRKQQQSILDFIEKGDITLIASTTENPYHYIYKAVLSRSIIVEFRPLKKKDITDGLKKIIERYNRENKINIIAEEGTVEKIAAVSGGDMRYAINVLEVTMAVSGTDDSGNVVISDKSVECSGISDSFSFDRDGEEHYNLLSAFQKSIRGSDPDAAVYYLACLLKGGDLAGVCRRLLVTASEDIGLAYPNAIAIVKSCVDSAMQVGLPEARIILAQAVILLASSPKSNTVYMAIEKAMSAVNLNDTGIPAHLRDTHYEGADKLINGAKYRYPHDFPENYVRQQYLPDSLKNSKFYEPNKNNRFERSLDEFLKKLKD